MGTVAKIFAFAAMVSIAPSFLKFVFVALGAMLSSQPDAATAQVAQSGADLIVAAIIPWWLNPLEFFASLPGILGGLVTLGFLFLLFKTGQ